jgi:RNA polymerase sigma factor (sigma-70 family)
VLLLVDAAALTTEDKSVVEAAAAAIEAGAAGVLDTAQSLDTLLETLTMAEAGSLPETIDPRHWIDQHDLTGHRRLRRLRRRLNHLTPREREILNLLYYGHRATSIAEQCGISVATVRSQIRSILTKLNVHSQLEAVALLR